MQSTCHTGAKDEYTSDYQGKTVNDKNKTCLGHFLDIPLTILLCNLFKISCLLVYLLPYCVGLMSIHFQFNINYKGPKSKIL